VTPNIRRSEARRLDGPIADAATHWDDRRFSPDPMLVLARITDAVCCGPRARARRAASS
jgi:hypothetical protein